jgi:hypothetical protein
MSDANPRRRCSEQPDVALGWLMEEPGFTLTDEQRLKSGRPGCSYSTHPASCRSKGSAGLTLKSGNESPAVTTEPSGEVTPESRGAVIPATIRISCANCESGAAESCNTPARVPSTPASKASCREEGQALQRAAGSDARRGRSCAPQSLRTSTANMQTSTIPATIRTALRQNR